jgi:hypothetical protein
MVRLFLFLFLINLALTVIALIDCISADSVTVRTLPKVGWALLILFLPVIGSLGWFFAGRPQRPAARPTTWHPAGSTRPVRPLAPDDDPQFLRDLSARTHNDELIRREAERRRREEESRRQAPPVEGDSGDRPLGEV